MTRLAITFALGLIFGCGLYLSGMTDPQKVLGFLDVAGLWDPSLAFVMGGAILVALPAFRLAAKRRTSLLGYAISPPPSRKIDAALIVGSSVFGIGWGLSGVCPGPAVFNLGLLDGEATVFFAALIAGLALERLLPLFLLAASPAEVEQDGR
ncbi:DUF6691 family protein [Methylocystis parvus]|uniref:YeeE/YedE family protein n=1 Tax=Methylocystis parvus TaxID=134 RepID=A0A6B8M511_9HYPH|nr:DUF6691 family protein [Methylocystis parvus]QGM97425.1 hypothetical protein F7D14_08035 [Methylocystis parvus]WBJ98659.1 hypothetical protein MMG94_11570 [Methylocystis parvus OBBP]